MRHFTLTLTVAEDALGETITAVTPLIVAQRVVMGPIAPIVEQVTTTEKRKRRGDSPVHETRLGKLVLEILSTGPCSVDDLSQELRSKGFAATSVSPVTSKLTAEGLIERYTSSLNGRGTRFYKLLQPSK